MRRIGVPVIVCEGNFLFSSARVYVFVVPSERSTCSCHSSPVDFGTHLDRVVSINNVTEHVSSAYRWFRVKKVSIGVIHDNKDSFGVSALHGFSVNLIRRGSRTGSSLNGSSMASAGTLPLTRSRGSTCVTNVRYSLCYFLNFCLTSPILNSANISKMSGL